MRFFGLTVAIFGVAIACGGRSGDQNDAGAQSDAGNVDETDDDASDAAAIAYPAPHTAMPLVDYNGGRVIPNPNIVTVTWASDDPTMVARLQQFDDIITTTSWWTAVSSEYCEQPNSTSPTCIGPGTAGAHVVINDPPPASFTDSASQGAPSTIKDFIQAQITATLNAGDAGATDGGVSPGFPAPDGVNTLYVIYLPAGVSVSLDGDASCGSYLAYHDTLAADVVDAQVSAPYAIIPRCGTKESTATDSASHEIIEASTDPDIGINSIAYYMLNQTWASEGGEVGDLCTGKTTTESSFVVQRIWSNKSVQAGEDPCVPVPSGEVYFNAAPQQQTIDLLKAGDTATINIDAFSDAPYPPWTLSAVDVAAEGPNQNSALLSFAFDKTSVQNGDHAVLTVTALQAIPNDGDELFVESQDANKNRHTWPVTVVAK